MLARKRARATRQQKSALIIQRNWRMAIQRFKFWQTRMAVMHIQAAWRGHVARTVASERRSVLAWGEGGINRPAGGQNLLLSLGGRRPPGGCKDLGNRRVVSLPGRAICYPISSFHPFQGTSRSLWQQNLQPESMTDGEIPSPGLDVE